MKNKITRATLKKFIKDNQGKLYIKNKSNFDGMVDCVMSNKNATFVKVDYWDEERLRDNNLGIKGLWLVGQSRDYFTPYEDEEFQGIDIYNSCGSDILAIRKEGK